MTSDRRGPGPAEPLSSRAFRITVDDGRDDFCALSIEGDDPETEWLISDTVCALENMR
ncbi:MULTISPECIES: hypothetical protein [Haloarcula]|uniref:hypothetical protein n=1 Tax=Haloarcula TaxID=2237 RepID=UPI0023EAA104|nr:hypothetical protein [Halomicroarcula sp. XH51]